MPVKPANTENHYALSFQQGEEKGFDHFFKACYPALCLFALRLTGNSQASEDIASAAFMKTWDKHAQLGTPAGIKAYLYQVVRHDCYKWLQQQQRQVSASNEMAYLHSTAEQDHMHYMIEAEVLRQLYASMQQLPIGCRKVFNKLYVEGKTVAETAGELQLSLSTVKTQKARGLLFLRKMLSIE